MEERLPRKLAAILYADVAGYSRLTGEDEDATHRRLRDYLDLISMTIDDHHGKVMHYAGDAVLAKFDAVVDALSSAVAIQDDLKGRNQDLPDERKVQFRIGVNLGDVIEDREDIYGDGVNVAARLESLAEPGGICISESVKTAIGKKLPHDFEFMGEQQVKNIEESVRAYRVELASQRNACLASSEKANLELPDKPSIAVLPFTNMSGDLDQEYFSDGITEDIITELSRFRELFVIARNSSFSYKGKQTKVQDIGRDLGVAYIVEGSVRKVGNRVRITAQLVEAVSGNHVWAERYDRELEDIFDLQDEITRTIVALLPVRLHSALVETMRRKPSDNLSAYDFFLHGRWLFDRTSGQDPKALELLKKAVEIDPACAQGHAYLALAHAYSLYNMHSIGDTPAETALHHIQLALADGEGDHFVQAAAGNVYIMCGKHKLADRHSAEAVALNPNAIYALLGRGYVISYLGDAAAGVAQLQDALRYDPHAPDFYFEQVAEASYMLRDYKRAIEIYSRWKNPPPHMNLLLAVCCAQQGREEDATIALKNHMDRCPKDFDVRQYVFAHTGMCQRPEDSEHWLEGYRKIGLPV